MADSIYDLTLEEGTLETRKQMFEEIFGLEPVLRQKAAYLREDDDNGRYIK